MLISKANGCTAAKLGAKLGAKLWITRKMSRRSCRPSSGDGAPRRNTEVIVRGDQILGKTWGKLRFAFNNPLIKSRATFNLERVYQQDSTACSCGGLAIAIRALSAADFGTKQCVVGVAFEPRRNPWRTAEQVSSE